MIKPLAKPRRSLRFPAWDYSWEGVYFLTICTQNKEYLFGEIAGEVMHANAPGEMVLEAWEELPARFPLIQLDARVLMPNHFHGIVIICRSESDIYPPITPPPNIMQVDPDLPPERGEHKVRPYGKRPRGTGAGSLGRIVQAFKSLTTRQYIQGIKESGWPPFKGKLWQRNYYERIVRDEEEWERISEYIAAHPINWALDRENREVGKIKAEEPWQV